MPTIRIKVLLFASARQAAGGISQTEVELLSSEANTRQLRAKLAKQYPGLATLAMDETNITLALNEEYLQEGQVVDLKQGDTVALIPPISGG